MMKKILAFVLAAMLVAPVPAAFAQTAPAIAVPPPPSHTESVTPQAPVSQVPPAAPAATTGLTSSDLTYQYRLGAGDKIHVGVFGEDDLSTIVTVTGEGKVSLPLIGEVNALGLTAPQLQVAIQDAYRQGYLKDPKVNIEVLNFRPFYILGEVNKPGEYPYDNGMTVVNAVALASGFTYRADKKKVYIKHMGDVKETEVPLTTAVGVNPGDTVRIAERYF